MKRSTNKYDDTKPTILTLPDEILFIITEDASKLSLTCRRCYHLRSHPPMKGIASHNAPTFDSFNMERIHHATLKRFSQFLVDFVNDTSKSKHIIQLRYKHYGNTTSVELQTLKALLKLPNLERLVYQTDKASCINTLARLCDPSLNRHLRQINIKVRTIPDLALYLNRLLQLPHLSLLTIDTTCNNMSVIKHQVYNLIGLFDLFQPNPDVKVITRFIHSSNCVHNNLDYDIDNYVIIWKKCVVCLDHFTIIRSFDSFNEILAKAYQWPDDSHYIREKLLEIHDK